MEKFALNVDLQAAQPSRLHPAPSITANQMTASSNSAAFKLANEVAESRRCAEIQNFSQFCLGQFLLPLLEFECLVLSMACCFRKNCPGSAPYKPCNTLPSASRICLSDPPPQEDQLCFTPSLKKALHP
ncbi:hypothetical protein MHYP_G00029590 [Metynnis hypsauchen]